MRLKATEVDVEARAVLVKRSFAIQTSAFDSLDKTELDCLLVGMGWYPGPRC
jgi:hypothetical protein